MTPALSDRIDQMAKAQVHAGRTPGIAVGVVEDGRLVYARGFGFSDLSKHVPMSRTRSFTPAASPMQFTAAAVLLLVQDGKLKLDDHVSKYVPEFQLGATISIAQLLTQTSGLPPSSRIPGVSADRTHPIKLAASLAALDQMKPVAAPGSVYADDPLNYLLAGLDRRTRQRRSALRFSRATYLHSTGHGPHVSCRRQRHLGQHATGYTRAPHTASIPRRPGIRRGWGDGGLGFDDLRSGEVGC